jgi:hypothetical protein
MAWLRRKPWLSLACLLASIPLTLSFVQTGMVTFEPHRSVVKLAGVIRRSLYA